MSLIKIIANGIELDFVKDTLSIKKENNAFIRSFTVSYSSVPFLIIENSKCKQALGTRDLTSVKKIKTIPVIVFEGGNKFNGELQVLSYLNGFRKCNLKYATELLSIMNKKIGEFMPIVSVIPSETDPVAYIEESNEVIPGYENWGAYPLLFINETFPTVKWQFPTMNWKDKFGEKLEATDEWYSYQNKINAFETDASAFIENEYTEDAFSITGVFNRNVPSPQVHLLSPLFYALESLDFVFSGSFTDSVFIKKLLFLSAKDNLTKVTLSKDPTDVTFTGAFVPIAIFSDSTYQKTETITVASAGTYAINYSFTFNGPEDFFVWGVFSLRFFVNGISTYIFSVQKIEDSSITVSGSIEFNVDGSEDVDFYFTSQHEVMPASYTLEVAKVEYRTFYEMHPTINLSRYVPDWTFGSYINALQNFFNLDITIDDFTKKIVLNFNEEAIANTPSVKLNKSLGITSYDQAEFNAFYLKYENDQDDALWVTTTGAETFGLQTSDFVEKLDSKFKLVPVSYTADLSDNQENKSGVGLLIYNEAYFPFVSQNYLGQSLDISSIYEVYWKKWLKFRLNGSIVEMSGSFTETEINKILQLKRVVVDNQEYIVLKMEYSETKQNNYILKFSLVSVTF